MVITMVQSVRGDEEERRVEAGGMVGERGRKKRQKTKTMEILLIKKQRKERALKKMG